MPRVQWQLGLGRPCVQVNLSLSPSRQPLPRTLLADTGAGSRKAGIDLILLESGCLRCGGKQRPPVILGGAYTGSFPTFVLPVEIPAFAFA